MRRIILTFDDGKDIEHWKSSHQINQEATPKEAILKLINNDKNIIRKIIDHPISRQIVFNILKENNLATNLKLKKYSITFNEEYLDQKISYEEL